MKTLILSQAIYEKELGRRDWFEPIAQKIRENPKLKDVILAKAKKINAQCIINKL